MEQPQISVIELPAKDALYKQCSGAAVAAAWAIVRLSQMNRDEVPRKVDPSHVNALRISMEEEGVRKGEILHGYIDVEDPAWGGRSEAEALALMDAMDSQNKLNGDGKVVVGVLPEDIPIRLSNGTHRLHAYCRYIVDHWDDIKNVRPPLNQPPTDRPFAENLGKSAAEILAQDDAWWLVSVEYIRK